MAAFTKASTNANANAKANAKANANANAAVTATAPNATASVENKTLSTIQEKFNWSSKWASSPSLAVRLVVHAAIEGIFFSSILCTIAWLKKHGHMQGFATCCDHWADCDTACKIFRQLKRAKKREVTSDTIKQIITQAVQIEKRFAIEAMPLEEMGISAKSMSQYIESVADGVIDALGHTKVYKTTNPFPWMEAPDVFEKHAVVYEKNVNATNAGSAVCGSAAKKPVESAAILDF